MSDQKTYHAYTTRYEGLSTKLYNDIELVFQNKKCAARALWDTGATGTCISKDVVKELGLISTGKINIATPSGTSTVDVYLIDVLFPNHVVIKDVRVCGTEIGNQGIQALIGMDIITLGDLAVSNANGDTMFSFRIPSKEHTDYVKQLKIEKVVGPKHGQGKRKKKKK